MRTRIAGGSLFHAASFLLRNSSAFNWLKPYNKKAQIPLSIWAKSCVPMQEKYELVARVIAGNTKAEVALNAGINPGMLYQLY